MPITYMRPRGLNKKDAAKAAIENLQGTASPEGVITGVVEWQMYTQFDGSGNVVGTWQFQGTLSTNTGWVNLTP